MPLFELTSDERVVTQPRHFLRVSDRVHVHAVLRQRLGNAALQRVPEERPGADQDDLRRGGDLTAEFDQPVFDLVRISEFAARHGPLWPEYYRFVTLGAAPVGSCPQKALEIPPQS